MKAETVAALILLGFLLGLGVVLSGCAPKSRLVRVEYGPLGIPMETWQLADRTCERWTFVGPYSYRSIVPCPEK